MCINNGLQDNPVGIIEIRDEVRTECEKFGKVKKVMVFDVRVNWVFSLYKLMQALIHTEKL